MPPLPPPIVPSPPPFATPPSMRDRILSQLKAPSTMTEEELDKELRQLDSLGGFGKSFRESVREDQLKGFRKSQIEGGWQSTEQKQDAAQRFESRELFKLEEQQLDTLEGAFRQANPGTLLTREEVREGYLRELGPNLLGEMNFGSIGAKGRASNERSIVEGLAQAQQGEMMDPEVRRGLGPGWLKRRESDIRKGANQIEMAYNTIGSFALDTIGADELAADWAFDYQYDKEEADMWGQTGLNTAYFGDSPGGRPEGLGGFIEWGFGTAAELLPMVADVAASSAVGAMLSGPGAPVGAPAGAALGLFARKAMRDAAAKKMAVILAKKGTVISATTRASLKEYASTRSFASLTDDALRTLGDDAVLASGGTKGAEKAAAEEALKKLGLRLETESSKAAFAAEYSSLRKTIGATAGAYSAVLPLEAGGAMGDYADAMGIPTSEIDLWTGIKLGLAGGVAASADVLPVFLMAGRIFSHPVKQATTRTLWQKAKPFVKGSFQGAGVEGSTEAFQEFTTIAAVRQAKGLDTFDFTEEEWDHIKEAGAKGTFFGFAFPAIVAPLRWAHWKHKDATVSERFSGALDAQTKELDALMDPEHIVEVEATVTPEAGKETEGVAVDESIPVSVAREPSREQKIAINRLAIAEATGTITEEEAASQREVLLTDEVDRAYYAKEKRRRGAAAVIKKQLEIEDLALRELNKDALTEEEQATLETEIAEKVTTSKDKAHFNRVRLELISKKAASPEVLTREDLALERMSITERREIMAMMGSEIAGRVENWDSPSLDQLREEAKTQAERNLIDSIIEFESANQEVVDDIMDLTIPAIAQSPMQEGLAQYIWARHTAAAEAHAIRMEDAAKEANEAGGGMAWGEHMKKVIDKWGHLAVAEVTPQDAKLYQLGAEDPSLTHEQAKVLNTAQARLEDEGHAPETITAAQLLKKASEINEADRKHAKEQLEEIAKDNPTLNKAIEKVKKVKKAPKVKKAKKVKEAKEVEKEDVTEETKEAGTGGLPAAVVNKKREAIDREIDRAKEATDDPHARILHLFKARKIAKDAGMRLTKKQAAEVTAMERALKAEGYTWKSLDGEEFQIGRSTVEVTTGVDGAWNLEHVNLRKHDGEHQVVLRTHSPQISKDGKISKAANVDYVDFGEITEIEKLQRKINSVTGNLERPKSAAQKAGLIESRDTLQKELDEKVAERAQEKEQKPVAEKVAEKPVEEKVEEKPVEEKVVEEKVVEEEAEAAPEVVAPWDPEVQAMLVRAMPEAITEEAFNSGVKQMLLRMTSKKTIAPKQLAEFGVEGIKFGLSSEGKGEVYEGLSKLSKGEVRRGMEDAAQQLITGLKDVELTQALDEAVDEFFVSLTHEGTLRGSKYKKDDRYKALEEMLLGEKVPAEIVNSETGEVILAKNRKVFKKNLNSLWVAKEIEFGDVKPDEESTVRSLRDRIVRILSSEVSAGQAIEVAPEGTQQAKTTVGGLVEFPGGLDTTKPVAGTHKSINLESIEEGFEVRVSPQGTPVGVSIARIPSEELSSPTLAEPAGTAGIVDVIVRGKGLDYETEAGRKLVDELHRKSEEASEAAMEAGAEPGTEGTMVSAIPALLDMGYDWVNGWNSIGPDRELHVINPSVIEVVGTRKGTEEDQARAKKSGERRAKAGKGVRPNAVEKVAKNIGVVAEVAVEEVAVEEEAVEEKKEKAARKPKPKLTKAQKEANKIKKIEDTIVQIQSEQSELQLTNEEKASAKPLTDEEVFRTAENLSEIVDVAEASEDPVVFPEGDNSMQERLEFINSQLGEEAVEEGEPGMAARIKMVEEMLGALNESGADVALLEAEELVRLQKEYNKVRRASYAKKPTRTKAPALPEELQDLRREFYAALRKGSEGLQGTIYTDQNGNVFFNPKEVTDPSSDIGVHSANYIPLLSVDTPVSATVEKLASALNEQYGLPNPGEHIYLGDSVVFSPSNEASTDPESGQAVPVRKRKSQSTVTRKAQAKKTAKSHLPNVFKAAEASIQINPNPTTKVEEAEVYERELDDKQINWIVQNIIDDADLDYEGVETVQKRGRVVTQLGTDLVHKITHEDGNLGKIAEYYGVSEEAILERNGLDQGAPIKPGSKLLIPTPPLDWWTIGATSLAQFVKRSGAVKVGVGGQKRKRRNVGRRAAFLRDTKTGLIHLASIFYGDHLQIEDPATGSVRKKDAATAGFVRPKVDKETLESLPGTNKYEILSLVRLRKKTGVGNILAEYGKDMPPLSQGDYNALMRLLDIVANREYAAKEKVRRGRGVTGLHHFEPSLAMIDGGAMVIDPNSHVDGSGFWGTDTALESNRIPSIGSNQNESGSAFLAKLFYSMRRDRKDREGLKGTKPGTLAQMDKETALRELAYFYTKNRDIFKAHLEEIYSQYIDEIKREGLDAGRSWPEIMEDITSALPTEKPQTQAQWDQLLHIAIPVVGEVVHQRLAHEGETELSYFTADYAEVTRKQRLDEGVQGSLSGGTSQAISSHRERETWNTAAKRRALALQETGIDQITVSGLTDEVLSLLKEHYAIQVAGMELGNKGTMHGAPMELWALANALERDNRPATRSPKIGDNAKRVRIFNERVWSSIKTAVEKFVTDSVSEDSGTSRFSPVTSEDSPFSYMPEGQIKERFQFLANVAGQYGIPLFMEEGGAMEFGQILSDKSDPEKAIIILSMIDAAQPSARNVDNLLEELTHHVFRNLDEKQKHQLLLSVNDGASNYFHESLSKLSPKEREVVLKEEDLVRSVLDSIANNRELEITDSDAKTGVKALIKALIQYLKDAYDRIVMTVQGEKVNPDIAERFLKRRLLAFLSGRPIPQNIFQALGRSLPEERLRGFTQANGERIPVRHNSKTGRYDYEAVVPDSPEAAAVNVANASRPQDTRFSAVELSILLLEGDFTELTKVQQEEISHYAFVDYMAQIVKLLSKTKDGITESEVAGEPSRLDGSDWKLARTELFHRWGGHWIESPGDASVIIDAKTGEPVKVWHVLPAGAIEGPTARAGSDPRSPKSRYTLPSNRLKEFTWAVADRDVALSDYENAHEGWVASKRRTHIRSAETNVDAPVMYGGFARADKVLTLPANINSVEEFIALLEDGGVDLSSIGGAEAVIGSMEAGKEGPAPAFFYVDDILELTKTQEGPASKVLALASEQGFGAISVNHPFEDTSAYLLLDGGSQFKATTIQDWRGISMDEEAKKVFSESPDVRYSSTASSPSAAEASEAAMEAGAGRAAEYDIETTPAVDKKLSQSKTDNEALEVIAKESPSAEARMLAEGLLKGTTEAAGLKFTDSVRSQMAWRKGTETWGTYSTARHSIEVSLTSPSLVGVTLHEIAHAKTIRSVNGVIQDSMDRRGLFKDHGGKRARSYSTAGEWLEVISERVAHEGSLKEPVSREELAAAELHWIYNRLRLRDDFKTRKFYGAKNLNEMIAEAWSNPAFRNYLKGIKVSELGLENLKGGRHREAGVSKTANLWGRFKQAIADLLGLNIEEASVLSRIMDSSSTVMESEANAGIARRKDWRSFGVAYREDPGTDYGVRYSPVHIGDPAWKRPSSDVRQENVASVDIAAMNFMLNEVVDVIWDNSPAARKLYESKEKLTSHYKKTIEASVETTALVRATVSPDIVMSDLNGQSHQDAARMALALMNILRGKISKESADAHRELGRKTDIAVKKFQKLNELERNYKDLTWNMSEMWGEFRSMISELKKETKRLVKHGKDASRLSQVLGVLGTEVDKPISRNYLTALNKILQENYGRPFSNFNKLVEQLAQHGDKVAFGRLSGEKPDEAVRRVSAAIQSLSVEMGASPEMADIMAAFMVANPLHVGLMQLRRLTIEEGRDEIMDLLEAARISTPKNIAEIEKQARATVKNRNLLTRLMIEVNKIKRESKRATDEANKLQNRIDMGNEAQPTLLQARISLEDTMGIQSQFNLHDGVTLYVPDTESADPLDVKNKKNQVIYFKGKYRDHEKHIRKMTDWLMHTPEYARGQDYRLVEQQRDSLERDFVRDVLDVDTHYGALGFAAWFWRASKVIPITDRMRLIGLHEGASMAQMFNDYNKMGRDARDLEKYGHKFTASGAKAMKATGLDEATFFQIFYDQPLKHLENNKDRLFKLDMGRQVVDGIEMIKAYFAGHPDEATRRMALDGWTELKVFYYHVAEANTRLRNHIDSLGPGALVEDEIGGEQIFRKMIGNVWTVSRGFNDKAVAIINHMSPIWSAEGSPFRNRRYNFAEAYEKNPDKLREDMIAFFAPEELGGMVLTDFLQPILRKGGVSLFQAPLVGKENYRRMATREEIDKAWMESEGNVITFAEALWATTTSEVTEDQIETSLTDYVGEVMQVLSGFYNNMYESMTGTSNSWTAQSAPRDLMDARETESYPSDFMDFNRLDRLRLGAVANRASMHAAFGRDFEGFHNLWDQASKRAQTINSLRMELEIKAKDTGRKLADLLDEKKAAEPVWKDLTVNQLKSSRKVVEDLKQIKHEFTGFTHLAGGRTLDDTVMMEVIGSIAGNAVQGLKTIVNDTSSLVFQPIMNMGVNAHTLKTLLNTGKHFAAQTANTLLNAAHRQFRFEFDFGELAKKYGAVDGTGTQVYKQLIQTMNSASSNLEIMSAEINRPTPEGANLLQRGALRIARTLSSSKEMGMGQAREGEYEAPGDIVLQPLGPFGTFAMIGQMSAASGMANTASYIMLKAAEYYAQHPAETGDITQEMLGGWEGVAPDKAIEFMRSQLSLHSGMNIDRMARDMGVEIRKTGKVTPFINSSFLNFMYVAAQSNITGESTASSRPAYFLTSNVGRTINPLFGWSLNQAYKSTFKWNRQEDMSEIPGALNKLKYYFIPLAASLGFVTVMAMLRDELEEEVIGVKQRGIDPLSARGMVDAIDRVGMFGVFGSVVNEGVNLESSRTWSIENRVLVINTVKQLFNLSFRLHQSGYNFNYENFWRPSIQLMGGGGYLQYGQILNNVFSLDNAEARYSARLNAKNAIISAGKELKMEIKKGGGGWAPTPITPHLTRMEISALANDSGAFRLARKSAIEAAMAERGETEHEAEQYVDSRFASNHPMRRAFKSYPTSADILKLYDQMSDESRTDVQEAVRLYNHYLEQLGRGSFEGTSGRSGKKRRDPFDFSPPPSRKDKNRDKELIDSLRNR